MTFLQGARLPGMWLVLTEWDAEPIPDGDGGSATPANCRATALALVPRVRGGAYLQLTSCCVRHPERIEPDRLAGSRGYGGQTGVGRDR